MAIAHRAVVVAVASSVVALLAAACGSFGEEAGPGADAASAEASSAPDGGAEAAEAAEAADLDGASNPNGCPANVVFLETFDTGVVSPTLWSPTVSGSGMISATAMGQFVSSVSTASGEARIGHRLALPAASRRVCITLGVRFTSNPAEFGNGGYVAVVQNDIRARSTDVQHAFFGLGVDPNGVFTNIVDPGGPARIGRPGIPTTSATSKNILYRVEPMGSASVVTVEVDGIVRDTQSLALAQVGDIDLDLGIGTSASGTHSAVKFVLDAVEVRAE